MTDSPPWFITDLANNVGMCCGGRVPYTYLEDGDAASDYDAAKCMVQADLFDLTDSHPLSRSAIAEESIELHLGHSGRSTLQSHPLAEFQRKVLLQAASSGFFVYKAKRGGVLYHKIASPREPAVVSDMVRPSTVKLIPLFKGNLQSADSFSICDL